ncbi:MAG: BON domain-containing protein, partial [Planctomycetaceae bacterium]
PPAVAPPDAPLPASPPTAAQATPEPNEATDTAVEEFELLHRVNLELARYPALAGLALQFLATRGHVTVVGDLRSEYERQLVRHFVKSVRGVTELTDLTRVPAAVGPTPQAVASAPAPVRRRSSSRGVGTGWALPPHAKSMAALALITLLAWTGFSFAKRGDGLPKVHPARGQVLLPGYPLEGALLVLHPTQAGAIARPRATLRDDGHFELTTHSAGDGAPEGEYVVTTVLHRLEQVDGEPVPGPNQLPLLFAKPETSPLRVTIQRGTNDLPPIRLSP